MQAPNQQTFDVSLVSPSASIRRASVAEIWSVCRFVDALGGGVVTLRTGVPPAGVTAERESLVECLTTLDRMAGDHNATLALELTDYFYEGRNTDLLKMLSLRHTGFSLDTRLLSYPEKVVPLIHRLAPRLFHVRLLDGVVDLPGMAEALAQENYAEMVSLCFAAPRESRPAAARLRAHWEKMIADVRDAAD